MNKMRLFTSFLATVAMLAMAPAAFAAVSYSVNASTSDASPLSNVTIGAQIILDIQVSTDDFALAVAGSVNNYDNSVVGLNTGASIISSTVFNQVCIPSAGCFNGLTNQVGGAIAFAENAVGPGVEAEFLAALGLAAAGGNGALDPAVGAGVGQFQIVFDAIGAPGASTTLNIGTFAEYLDGYTGTVDSLANNTSVTVTIVPEPGTALLMGLGLAGLAGAGRRE
jgi:hypothetical protein